MNHDQLLDEAKVLEAGLCPEEKLSWAFRYSYVANHELRAVLKTVNQMRWILLSIGVPILIAIVLGLIRDFVG